MAEWRLRGSMSRRGNPYDNAHCESFIKTVKCEEVYLNDYETSQDVVNRLPRFLYQVYNEKRLHLALGWILRHDMLGKWPNPDRSPITGKGPRFVG